MSEAKAGYDKLFDQIMRRAGAIPYRVGGRVRVAYTDGTNPEAVEQMKTAVRVMADKMRLAERVAEPDAATKQVWAKAGLRQLDVCDEPCPDGVSLTECPVGWLVDRCRRYHFTLRLKPDGGLAFTPDDGWRMDDVTTPHGVKSGIRSVMPGWFAEACKRRRAEIVAFLTAGGGGEMRTPAEAQP